MEEGVVARGVVLIRDAQRSALVRGIYAHLGVYAHVCVYVRGEVMHSDCVAQDTYIFSELTIVCQYNLSEFVSSCVWVCVCVCSCVCASIMRFDRANRLGR